MTQPSTSGASAAYRGYRLQALYTLARVLDSGDSALVFEPEGAEDLAVWDGSSLVEIVQVKAHTENLTLTSFNPKMADSFFYRVAAALSRWPDVRINVVSFGDIGPELLKAITTDGRERVAVAKKLADYRFISLHEASLVLSRTEVTPVDRVKMNEDVLSRLAAALTGVDPRNSFDLLNFWLYVCAEGKTRITRLLLMQKVESVGRYASERAAHHREWFTAIEPIEDREIGESERADLSNEFQSGTAARYEHILANLDVSRPGKMEEIRKAFLTSRVVIVHGASGQGKSTVAHRYLKEFFPEFWRFRVKLIQDRRHAKDIATVLASQARFINVRMAVYLDVSPSDTSWADLVRELQSRPEIHILVTIREEDFRRANVSGTEFEFTAIELGLDIDEARELFEPLRRSASTQRFIDFEDAWNAFGSGGPLLEFAYLVTQGESLRDRLRQQVRRLSDYWTTQPAEMELLRLVSVAGAFEARLDLAKLVRPLGLNEPARTIELFEKEYLLRTSEDGALVVGLHPVRSSILSDLLSDPALHRWADSATTCLPTIYEPDLEPFLLYSFSRRRPDVGPVLAAISTFSPATWIGVRAVVRGLLWLGLADYAEENRALIDEAAQVYGHAWQQLLDQDVCSVVPLGYSFLEIFEPHIAAHRREEVMQMRARQTDKQRIFALLKAWLSNLAYKPPTPLSDREWPCLAEVLFWSGWLRCSWRTPEWFTPEWALQTFKDLPIDTLADLILALHTLIAEGSDRWPLPSFSQLEESFRSRTGTAVLEKGDNKLSAHFIIGTRGVDATPLGISHVGNGSSLGGEAEVRIRLMSELFPGVESYGCMGYGHRISSAPLPTDDTFKEGVAKKLLPPRWLTHTDVVFRNLVGRRFRPNTWTEFAAIVMDVRSQGLEIIEGLSARVDGYFRNRGLVDPAQVTETVEWSSCKSALERGAELPSCVLDEWGFGQAPKWMSGQLRGSGQSNRDQDPWAGRSVALERYRDLNTAISDYFQSLSNFLMQAHDVLRLSPLLGRKARNKDERRRMLAQAKDLGLRVDFINLSVNTFVEAITNLSRVQGEFRNRCGRLVNAAGLLLLEERERAAYGALFSTWSFFAFHPQQVIQRAADYCAFQVTSRLKSLKNDLNARLRRLQTLEMSLVAEIRENIWERESCVLVTVNARSPLDIFQSIEAIVDAARRSLQKVGQGMLGTHIIHLHCRNVIILPLVRGRSLRKTFWKIYAPVLLGDSLGWWNLVEQPMPDKDLEDLKVRVWDDPLLKAGASFAQGISAISFLATHLFDVASIPTLDGHGEEMIKDYLARVLERECEIATSALTASDEMLAPIQHDEALAGSGDSERFAWAAGVMRALQLLGTALSALASDLQNNSEAANLAGLVRKSSDILSEAATVANLSYLLFSSVVLDRLGVD
jgi:hypothetical protein